MAEATRLTGGAVLLLAGTALIYLLALMGSAALPRSRWFFHPLLLLPAAGLCILLGALVLR